MLIVYSILAVIAFIIMSLYENEYAEDKLITNISLWLKIMILVPLILITLLKAFVYFQPLIVSTDAAFFDKVNHRLHRTNTYQFIDFRNDYDVESSYYFFLKKKDDTWVIAKPLNKFDLSYKSEFPGSEKMQLYFNADTMSYSKVYILNADSLNSTIYANSYVIPVNKFVVYSSELSKSTIPQNINHYHNTKQLIFIFSALFIYIYLIIRNYPPNGKGRIIILISMLFLISFILLSGYEEIMYFWTFRI